MIYFSIIFYLPIYVSSSSLLPSTFPSSILNAFLFPLMHAMYCIPHPILLDLITLIFGDK